MVICCGVLHPKVTLDTNLVRVGRALFGTSRFGRALLGNGIKPKWELPNGEMGLGLGGVEVGLGWVVRNGVSQSGVNCLIWAQGWGNF